MILALMYMAGCLVGLPFYIAFNHFGWTTDTAAFVAGGVGQLVSVCLLGVLIDKGSK